MLRKALLNIYSKEFHPVSDIEENLFNEIWKGINMATARGFRDAGHPDIGDGFADAIRHSNAVFSAFKVHRAQNDMARLLLDSDGTLKPFSQWSKEVMPIASHQCRTWLRTEYDTAVIRAHQAADWRQFMREKDVLPNLRWMPSTSVTPGEDHKIFWNVVRPVDDPFWNRHRPGDRWNCKCSLSSTTDPPTRIPGGTSAPASDPQPGLKGNPAVTRSLFSDDHPYFPSDCSSCPFKGGISDSLMRFFGARRKKDCFKCRNIDKRLKKLADPKYLAKSEYYELKHDPDYHDVRYDKKTGGVRATHVGHNENTGKKEFFNNTMSGGDLEQECAEQLFKLGHKVILCDESKEFKPGEKASALDLKLDGKMMDIKSITGNGWYWRPLVKKNEQLYKYNLRPDVTTPAEALCLYFHKPSMFNEKNLRHSINMFKHFYDNSGQYVIPLIKRIYVVLKGSKYILHYDV